MSKYYSDIHLSEVKVLFSKLKLKCITNKRFDVLHKIMGSLNMVYPYQFFMDEKGVPNYAIKSIILDQYSIDLEIVRKYKRAEYLQEKFESQKSLRDLPSSYLSNIEFMSDEDIEFMRQYIAEGEKVKDKNVYLFNECYKMVNADTQRKKRLRQRVERIMGKGSTYFLTLTFNDDTLSKTDAKTRRTYVSRFLKSISDYYVGNVDFGKLKGREHYHAVIHSDVLDDIQYIYTKNYGWICSECEQFKEWSKLGFYSIKSCGKDEKDKQKLAWYVSKLTNHAVKETTKRNALIYSR